ncbi:MAG: metallophosphoesterase family protein [Clostridia bacterium]|nr:metallophosphoesterase family protein [Clostridia bacterium]
MLKFKDGKFRIMQIADVQEDWPVNPDTIRLIDAALEKIKPDLVVFTGDQIQGYSACYKTDTYNKVKNAINAYITPIAKRGIPFTLTFGNHDDDCVTSKAAQLDIYACFEGCTMGEAHSKDDPATHFLNIKDSKGEKDIFALYLIDSNKKEPDGAYSPVRIDQLHWLEEAREKNGYIPALAFQHIPVPEFYDILKKVPFYTKGALEAYKSRKNTFWVLPGKEGFFGETPAVPEINNGEFDLLKKHGDILGLFVGHDHNNSFVRKLEGIDLGYTQGCGFNTYGPADKRGVRIFELDENDLRNYRTYTVTAGELGVYEPTKKLQEFIYRNAPTCVDEVITNVKRVAAVTLAVTAVVKFIKLFK